MKCMQYSKAEGFTEMESPAEWEPEDTHESWLNKCGLGEHPWHDGLCSQRDGGAGVATYTAKNGIDNPAWAAMVEVDNGDNVDSVFVRTRADLLNLRMALAPIRTIEVAQRFDDLVTMAEKALQAWREHR